MEFLSFSTPLGQMALGEEEGTIVRLYLPSAPTPRLMPHETPLLIEGRRQVLEYLAGERQVFDVPIAPWGTPFQQRVWAALRDIPYGQKRTYREIALAVGCPKGFRAVGMACNRNPIPIIIPCHRVVGVGGALIGYSGGAELKQTLLDLEQKNG